LRFAEFFQAEDGRLSMTRLIVLLTWPPATWVVLNQHDQLPNYLGAYVISYALGKGADIFMGGKNANTSEILETYSDGAPSDDAPNNRVSKRKSRVRG